MSNVTMASMTVKDITEYLEKNQTVIIPYGVVEQHGYHLPLDTDIKLAEAIAFRLAEKLGCIVAPTLNYSFSGGMLKGTINIKPNTFANMVGEIIESLVLQGFKNIIIIPGHGGSECMLHLKESLRILKWLNPSLHDAMILMTPHFDFAPSSKKFFLNRDYHAGESETSRMMYLYPETVRREIVMDTPEIAEMMRNDPDAYQKRTAFTNMRQEICNTEQHPEIKLGVMGYPEKADRETGRKLVQEAVSNMVPALQEAIKTAEEGRRRGKKNNS